MGEKGRKKTTRFKPSLCKTRTQTQVWKHKPQIPRSSSKFQNIFTYSL